MTTTSPARSRWRSVLGRYPTGVAIITSVTASGAPVGMVVGTFTSVSEDPPLVGFLPQRTSRTYAQIVATGRFRASVLGAGHEALCRTFFSSPPEARFADPAWSFDAHGVPWVSDATAWFDATVHDVLPAGDHVMVLGLVEDLGQGSEDGREPLVFLNGGYGTFARPGDGFRADDFGGRLRVATAVSGTVRQLTMELGVQAALSTVVHGDVVVLAADDATSRYVGTAFPFAAPMDPGVAAWSDPARRRAWLERGRAVLGAGSDADGLAATSERILAVVREQGYAISFGQTMTARFDEDVAASPADLAALWRSFGAAYLAYAEDPRPEVHASALQVPVFDAAGQPAYELVVAGLGAGRDPDRYRHVVATALDYGARLTRLIGGRAPADYPGRTV